MPSGSPCSTALCRVAPSARDRLAAPRALQVTLRSVLPPPGAVGQEEEATRWEQEDGSSPILVCRSRTSFTYQRPRRNQTHRDYPISLSYVTDLLFINRNRHLLRGFSRGFVKIPL